jgi:hemolysin activation/secretion protein
MPNNNLAPYTICGILVSTLTTGVQAAELTLPNIVPLPQKPLELPEPQVPQLPPLRIEPFPLPVPELQETKPITVHAISFRGNAAIPTAKLQKLVVPFLNRSLSFADLLELRSTITKAYRDQGYTLATVIIPAAENQKLNPESATLVIRCMEGIVEFTKFDGPERFQNFIQARLRRSLTPAVNEGKLIESIYFLNAEPSLKDIRVSLSPSAEPGKYILTLIYAAQIPIRGSVEIANDQTVSTGEIGGTVDIKLLSPLSKGDQFEATYFRTEGVERLGVQYQIPINARGGTASVKSLFSNTAIVQPPFDLLDITSSSQIYEFTLRQPLLRRVNSQRYQEFAVGISLGHTEVQGTLLGFSFPLILGADDQGRASDTVLTLFQDYQLLSARRVLGAKSSLKIGLPLAATLNSSPPDGEFLAWLGQASFQQKITRKAFFATRATLQLTDRQLFSFEQLPITGQYGVRGYPENALLGDSGGMLQTEFGFTPYSGRQGTVLIAPFFDYGLPFSTVESKQSLASIGLSLQYKRDYCTARLIFGVPLIPLANTGDSLQEQGLIGGIKCGF